MGCITLSPLQLSTWFEKTEYSSKPYSTKQKRDYQGSKMRQLLSPTQMKDFLSVDLGAVTEGMTTKATSAEAGWVGDFQMQQQPSAHRNALGS